MAAFPTTETQENTLKNFQRAQVTGRRRRDDLSSFLSYQNKSGMINEYFAPPPSFAPSLLQGQFMSGSLLRCEVIKARDGTKAASPWAGEVRRRGESAAARPRLHLYSSPSPQTRLLLPSVPTSPLSRSSVEEPCVAGGAALFCPDCNDNLSPRRCVMRFRRKILTLPKHCKQGMTVPDAAAL